MTRRDAPDAGRPLLKLRSLLAIRGLFEPSSLAAGASGVACTGFLRFHGGTRRKVILSIAGAAPRRDGFARTDRFVYGCGLPGFAGDFGAFYRSEPGPFDSLVSAAIRREERIAPAWQNALSLWTREPVVLDLPEGSEADRLPRGFVRAAAAAAGRPLLVRFHLRSACLQRCIFCLPEPRTYGRREWDEDLALVESVVDRVVRPAARRGVECSFRIEADDLAGHGRLDPIVRLLHAHGGSAIDLVIPATRLSDAAAARRISRLPGLETVTLTLFGCTARTHDAVAGRRGAFGEFLRAAGNVASERAARLVINAVVTAGGLSELDGMLEISGTLGASLTISALFADYPRHHETVRAVIPRVGAVREAMEAHAAGIAAAGAQIEDFPICAVPPELRSRAGFNARAPFNGYQHAGPCERCAEVRRCVGVPRGYLDAHGTRDLVSEPSSGAASNPDAGRAASKGA